MASFLKKLTGSDEPVMQEDNNLDSNLDYQFDDIQEDTVFDLPIDVYQDDNNIYLRSFIPGVKPEQIDIDITRDTVGISGERVEDEKVENENYNQRELIWGKFSKKVLLPNEIDVDGVSATTKHGMMVLKMPRLDKDRSVKISLN